MLLCGDGFAGLSGEAVRHLARMVSLASPARLSRPAPLCDSRDALFQPRERLRLWRFSRGFQFDISLSPFPLVRKKTRALAEFYLRGRLKDTYQKILNELSVEETPDNHDPLLHSQTSTVLKHLKSMDQSLVKLTDRVSVDETPYLLHIDRDTYNLLVELKNLLYHLFAQPSDNPSYAYDQQYKDQHQNSTDLPSSDREDLNIENDLGSHGVRPRKENIH